MGKGMFMGKVLVLSNFGFWILFWVWVGAIAEPVSIVPTGDTLDAEQFYITRDFYLPSGPEIFASLPMQALTWIQLPSFAVGVLLIPEFRADDFVFGISVFTWRLGLIMLLSFCQWLIVAKVLDGWLGRRRR